MSDRRISVRRMSIRRMSFRLQLSFRRMSNHRMSVRPILSFRYIIARGYAAYECRWLIILRRELYAAEVGACNTLTWGRNIQLLYVKYAKTHDNNEVTNR